MPQVQAPAASKIIGRRRAAMPNRPPETCRSRKNGNRNVPAPFTSTMPGARSNHATWIEDSEAAPYVLATINRARSRPSGRIPTFAERHPPNAATSRNPAESGRGNRVSADGRMITLARTATPEPAIMQSSSVSRVTLPSMRLTTATALRATVL